MKKCDQMTTLELLKYEKDRYLYIVNLLKKSKPDEEISGDLKSLVEMDLLYYQTPINLEESSYTLKSSQLAKGVYIYDYTVNFTSKINDLAYRNFNSFRYHSYRAIIITSLDIKQVKKNMYKITNNHPTSKKYNLIEDEFTIKFINKTFTSHKVKSSFIVYKKIKKENIYNGYTSVKLNAEYRSRTGELLCYLPFFDVPESCMAVKEDGTFDYLTIQNWVKENISMVDDPTKLVKITGYEQVDDFKKMVKYI